jgi:hypothetical protein
LSLFTGVAALANALPDMGAISSVNLLLNNIGIDQAKDLVGILKLHPALKTLCGITGNETETELDMSGKMRGAGDAIMLVPDIIDNGAMTKLDMSRNNFEGAAAGKAIGDMLTGNSTLKDLDLSGCRIDSDAAKGISKGLAGNGALSSANLLRNYIPVEQAQELVNIMRAKGNLTTLCGLSREETELDFSGQYLSDGAAVLIANDIIDMGALAKLNISNTHIEQGEPLQLITALCNTKGIELVNDNESDSDCDY